jgi:soluble lytic murein transglycosylase
MQIQPETAGFISERGGIAGDYRGPKTNIRMGTWYLNYLQNRYNGDERLVLAAYNSGEGQVDSWVSEGSFDVYRDIPSRRPASTSRTCPRREMFTKSCTGVI